jgi:hypothetical protein
MGSVVFVASRTPSAVGPGGRHRAYQTLFELQESFGAERVHTVDMVAWQERHRGAKSVAWPAHPLALLYPTGFSPRSFAPGAFVADYERMLASLPRPLVAVIDDARFVDVLAVNRRLDVPTVACLQNLESLDLATIGPRGPARLGSHLLDLASEVEGLRHCAARLFISKVEAGLVGGLGLESEYHPYLPLGEIRARLDAISRARAERRPDPGLFLVLGSAMHATTRRAMERIVEQVARHGLPDGVRLVLAGASTEKLPGARAAGIEALGWMEQERLDHLLVAASGALVPQFTGFGAVTRIVELSCAGLPVLTGRHPTFAIDLPPEVRVVGPEWADWREAIEDLSRSTPRRPQGDYDAWEAGQPRALRACMAPWLDDGRRPGRPRR